MKKQITITENNIANIISTTLKRIDYRLQKLESLNDKIDIVTKKIQENAIIGNNKQQ